MKAVLILALAASMPQQFDLHCKGTVDTLLLSGETSAPYTRTLRIDLQAKQWCADACDAVDDIARIEPNRIVLRNVRKDMQRGFWEEMESVDRVTGAHASMARNDPMGPAHRAAFSKGQCEVAPFTGFAKGPKKF